MVKTRLIQILWALFCFGFALTFFSFLQYWPKINLSYIFSPVSEYSENPHGFLFFTSENIIPNVTSSFHLLVDEITYQEGSAHVEISADFYVAMSNQGNATFFVLHAFGKFSNTSVVVNGQYPENYGKKETIIYCNKSSSSYLLIDVPKIDVGHIQVSINFIWKDIFWRTSFYKYNIVVPFSSEFPPYINEVGLPKEVINYNGILFLDETSEARLSVAKPEKAVFSETLPNPDLITFYSGKVWYLWDMKQRSNHHEYVSTAISIGEEVDDLKREYELSLSYFTLLLGIGIPTIISSSSELLRFRYLDS